MTASRVVAVGVDGCRGGWVAACALETRGGEQRTEVRRFARISDLAEWREGLWDEPVVACDVPMGLPRETGLRPCDGEARELLGSRRSSVFQAPSRAALQAERFEQARGLSRQAWGIVPKVREVDCFLRFDCACQDWLFEAHPETSLAELAGRPVPGPKRSKAGREARLRVLRRAFPDIRRRLRAIEWPRAEVGLDDVVDAYAALWTALRVERGEARVLGNCERDAAGLVMRIVV